jgi:hypothetical protein
MPTFTVTEARTGIEVKVYPRLAQAAEREGWSRAHRKKGLTNRGKKCIIVIVSD